MRRAKQEFCIQWVKVNNWNDIIQKWWFSQITLVICEGYILYNHEVEFSARSLDFWFLLVIMRSENGFEALNNSFLEDMLLILPKGPRISKRDTPNTSSIRKPWLTKQKLDMALCVSVFFWRSSWWYTKKSFFPLSPLPRNLYGSRAMVGNTWDHDLKSWYPYRYRQMVYISPNVGRYHRINSVSGTSKPDTTKPDRHCWYISKWADVWNHS